MSESNIVRVVVTIEPNALETIDKVAGALKSAGLKVDQVLRVLGTISGSVAQSKIPALKKVKGVAAVELDEEMKAI